MDKCKYCGSNIEKKNGIIWHDATNVLTDMCTFSPFGLHAPLLEFDTYVWSEENEPKVEYQIFDNKENTMQNGPELTEEDQIEIGQNDGTGWPPPAPSSDDTTDEEE